MRRANRIKRKHPHLWELGEATAREDFLFLRAKGGNPKRVAIESMARFQAAQCGIHFSDEQEAFCRAFARQWAKERVSFERAGEAAQLP